MLVKNTTPNAIKLRNDRQFMYIYPWQTEDVPEEFQRDPYFRLALSSGALVEVKVQPEEDPYLKPAGEGPVPTVSEEAEEVPVVKKTTTRKK